MRHFICLLLLASLSMITSCATNLDAKVAGIRAKKLPTLEQELAAQNLQFGAPMFVRVFKEEGTLEVWLQKPGAAQYGLFKSYKICAMSGGLGPKTASGDLQAPEGFYDITRDRLWPGSKYHLAANIGYPNAYDKANARTGHALMIHGECKSEGCFAMTSPVMEEIYIMADQALRNGQPAVPVHIFPFRMTDEMLAMHPGYDLTEFWASLQQGYDVFEKTRIPPAVSVNAKQYVFATPAI